MEWCDLTVCDDALYTDLAAILVGAEIEHRRRRYELETPPDAVYARFGGRAPVQWVVEIPAAQLDVARVALDQHFGELERAAELESGAPIASNEELEQDARWVAERNAKTDRAYQRLKQFVLLICLLPLLAIGAHLISEKRSVSTQGGPPAVAAPAKPVIQEPPPRAAPEDPDRSLAAYGAITRAQGSEDVILELRPWQGMGVDRVGKRADAGAIFWASDDVDLFVWIQKPDPLTQTWLKAYHDWQMDLIRGERVTGLINDPPLPTPPPQRLRGRVMTVARAGKAAPDLSDRFVREVLSRISNEGERTLPNKELLALRVFVVSAALP